MMKIKSIALYFLPLLLLSALLMACSSDDESIERQEGLYPLQLERATIGAISRADAAEPWANDGEIGVRIGRSGDIGQYRLNPDGTLDEVIIPIYGPKENVDITAWYPYTETTLDIRNQVSGYAGFDFLKAEATGVSLENPVSLTFNHVMSKVRVTLQQLSNPMLNLDLSKAVVSFLGNTRCVYKEGNLTSDTKEYITAYRNADGSYEALLPPDRVKTDDKFCRIEVEGKIFYSSLKSEIDLGRGKTYNYNVLLDVSLDLTTLTGDEYTFGNCILDGKNAEVQNKIIYIEDEAKIVIKNVKLTGNSKICCKGNATIILQGENVITSSSGYGIYTEGESGKILTIHGTDADKLTITTTGQSSPICATNHGGIIINGGCIVATNNGEGAAIGCKKNSDGCSEITINGGIIEAKGGNFGAGIGSSNNSTCGNILITGGTITAQGGGGGAGIGGGQTSYLGDCGDITITGGNVTAKGGNSASIGHGNGTKSGNISITGGTITVSGRSSIAAGNGGGSVTIGEGATIIERGS